MAEPTWSISNFALVYRTTWRIDTPKWQHSIDLKHWVPCSSMIIPVSGLRHRYSALLLYFFHSKLNAPFLQGSPSHGSHPTHQTAFTDSRLLNGFSAFVNFRYVFLVPRLLIDWLVGWLIDCSGECKAPAVVIVIEGGVSTLTSACEAVEADIPVLVFAGTGKTADFIAAAYDKREQPLVFETLHNIYVIHPPLCFHIGL